MADLLNTAKTKARMRVVGSDSKRRAHGWRFKPRLSLTMSLHSGGRAGKVWQRPSGRHWANASDGRALFIGTRPSSDAHFFARLLAEDDASVFALSYAADDEADPFAVARRGTRPTRRCGTGCLILTVLRAEARMAKRDPAELATFRSVCD